MDLKGPEDTKQREDSGEPVFTPRSPSYGPSSSESPPTRPQSPRELASCLQTPTAMNDVILIKMEDEDKPVDYHTPPEKPVLKSQRNWKECSQQLRFDTQKLNPNQPRYYKDRPPCEGVVAWWCKLSGKGAIVERGDRDPGNPDTMVSVKLSDIKPWYGALCPGSYVTYFKWDRGLYDFWVVRGHAYVLYDEAQNNIREYPYFREENYKSALEWLERQDENFDRKNFMALEEARRNPYLSA